MVQVGARATNVVMGVVHGAGAADDVVPYEVFVGSLRATAKCDSSVTIESSSHGVNASAMWARHFSEAWPSGRHQQTY